MAIKPEWEGKGYSFFQNTNCEYFPCHQTNKTEDFNCLFCYCPLYVLGESCGGNSRYTGEGIKDCSACGIPHSKGGYDFVLERLPRVMQMARRRLQPEKEGPHKKGSTFDNP